MDEERREGWQTDDRIKQGRIEERSKEDFTETDWLTDGRRDGRVKGEVDKQTTE